VEQPLPAPGAKLTLTIDDIAFGGDGVGHWGDFVVFVPFVARGERVEAELTEVKPRFARARLLRILQPAAERVEPPCRYFGECGGCQYQHIAYPEQLRLKHKQISDIFRRIGGFDRAVIDPVLPCPEPFGYRNRIMIRSQWDKFKQGLNIGFIRADNRLVVDIEECKIAEPALNQQIQQVRRHPPPKGGLKVVLRIAPDGWDLPPDSFFQNNFFLLPALADVVRTRVKDSGCRFLVDAYCGVGFFSIELAGVVEHFAGVEVDVAAIKAARQNAVRRNLTNGEFVVGRAEDLLPGILGRFDSEATTLILDPPRTGCPAEMLQAMRMLQPAQILYVSCHPATLARDLNVLCADDVFALTKIVPLDMFPQTQHIECVADVRKKTAPDGAAHSPCK
jgi:tRNA/tmRNA/rRNA uracil-C5-methylase (TrmA/RlmC/RlmD family)